MNTDTIKLTDLLSEAHTANVDWSNDDEKVISFDVLRAVATNDTDLFTRYVSNRLTMEEAKLYSYAYFPCFVETEALLSAELLCPSMLVGADHHCHLINYGDAFGILIIGLELSRNITVLTSGLTADTDEDVGTFEPQPFEQVQFMKFDPKIVQTLDIRPIKVSENPFSPCNDTDVTLNINFSKFIENPNDDEHESD